MVMDFRDVQALAIQFHLSFDGEKSFDWGTAEKSRTYRLHESCSNQKASEIQITVSLPNVFLYPGTTSE